MSERLGEAYGLFLRLSAFHATNLAVKRDLNSDRYPLPPEVGTSLSSLVSLAATWLSGFPAIQKWDQASKQLLAIGPALQPSASDFMRVAAENAAIAVNDAAEARLLEETAAQGGAAGQKASATALGLANNLLLTMAEVKADASFSNPAAAPSVLESRIDATLADARAKASELIVAMPENVRVAVADILSNRDGPERQSPRHDQEVREAADLQRSWRHLQEATVDNVSDAIAIFDSQYRLILCNESFRRFFNAAISPQASLSYVIEECIKIIDNADFWRRIERSIRDKVPISGEITPESRRFTQYHVQFLPDESALLRFIDITAAKLLEQALHDRESALVESERQKRDFVSNVSYELRAPLTTIIGYAELLHRSTSGLPSAARMHVAAVRDAAVQLGRSIDDVIDIAQVDAGELALELATIEVVKILESAVGRWRPAALESNIELIQDYRGSARIRGDVRRLGQLLDHLISNAIDRTPPGGTVNLDAEEGPGEVRIGVSDTGRGFPFHVQSHIFDRFIGRDQGGPGLGLALVKAIVELHGGWVALESEPGAGATFTCHFPTAGARTADKSEQGG